MKPTTEKKTPSRSKVLEEKAILAVMVCGSMRPPELLRAQSGQAKALWHASKSAARARDGFRNFMAPVVLTELL
jgi:hypothetical protein